MNLKFLVLANCIRNKHAFEIDKTILACKIDELRSQNNVMFKMDIRNFGADYIVYLLSKR